jgi:hypothetical protein
MHDNDDVLAIVYKIKDDVTYKNNGNKIDLVQKQDHKIQNFFRKLKVKIPQESYMTLDEYASFVFKLIDGQRTVKEIGETLYDQYGEQANPLYERLLVFLNHLESTLYIIDKVEKLDA